MKDKILTILRQFADRETCYEMEELAEAIEAAVRPSFSETIIENNTIKQTCNLGHTHTIEPYSWRGHFVPVLRLMEVVGRSMTTTEIKRKFASREQVTVAKCPSELVHFGAVRIAGSRAGNRLYAITTLGKDFLRGQAPLPVFAYKTDVSLPPEAPTAPLSFIHQAKKVDVEPILVAQE